MMRKLFWILFAVICGVGLPTSTRAAVSISEIAWMGTSDSANYEWIELHNDSASVVDVSDWTLSDGNNFSVTLSGGIPSGTYAVLERNRSSGAYITEEPFLIYSGALVNTGATLTLYNSTGDIIDRVADDVDVDGWDIGGDNTTKDTAQYTTDGWGTGKPSPGKANTTTRTEADSGDGTYSSGTSGGRLLFPEVTQPVRLTLADVDLKLATNIQTVATVGQVVPMEVVASGIGESILPSLVYRWNFGDGHATSGVKKLVHRYDFPGTYIITIEAAFLRHEQVAEHTITVLPVALSITQSTAGDIQINNDAPYAVDISEYTVVADRKFTFPPKTIIAPKASITISHYTILQEMGSDIVLYDRLHKVAATLLPQTESETSTKLVPLGEPDVDSEHIKFSNENFSFPVETPQDVLGNVETTMLRQAAGLGTTSITSTNGAETFWWWPYLACMAVMLCGIAAVVIPKQTAGYLVEKSAPGTPFFSPPIDETGK